jgi:hypothetical protein
MRGVIPPIPNTPSKRGAQLKHRDNFTLLPLPLYLVNVTTLLTGNNFKGSLTASFKTAGLKK